MAQNIMSISTDQLSDIGDNKATGKESQSSENESATIIAAKAAAESYVKDHPDSVFDKKKDGDAKKSEHLASADKADSKKESVP